MNKNTSIILFGIILIGAFLRLYHFQSFNFYADSARDILVAKHIIEIDGFRNIGPGASAGWGLIHNSPLYFWVLAIFWFFLRSPLLVSLASAFLGIFSIFIGYNVGKLLYNIATGISLAFFISISNLLISYSRSVYQPHLIPFIMISCEYLFIKSFQTKQLLYLLAYIQAIFIGLHMHYSFLPVFFVFSLWAIFLWARLYKNSNLLPQLAPVVFYVLQLLLWISLTSVKTPFDQVYFFIEVLRKFQTAGSASIPILRSNQIITSLFSITSDGWIVAALLLATIVTGLCMSVINALKSKDYYLLFILSLVLSVATTSFYTDPEAPTELYTHYFSPYYILVPTLVAYLINRYTSNIQFRLLLILVFGYLLFRGHVIFNHTSINRYRTMEKISQMIYADYISLRQNEPSFAVFDHNPNEAQFDYYTGQYYYFLENYFKKPLVYLTNDDRNILPIARNPSTYYLVCSWFPSNPSDERLQKACINPFRMEFLSNKIFFMAPKIDSISTNNRSFHIYRFDIQSGASVTPNSNQRE